MTIEQMILGVALATAIAVVVLVLFAVRQSRQSRHIDNHIKESRATCQRLEIRIDTVAAQCDTEFGGVKNRLSQLETGS